MTVIRETAATELATVKEMAETELAAVREQIDASVKGNEAVREAARAQLQPMVFAHADAVKTGTHSRRRGRRAAGERVSPRPGAVGFGYRLKNEGTGIALNIQHGVEIDGHKIPFEGESVPGAPRRRGAA